MTQAAAAAAAKPAKSSRSSTLYIIRESRHAWRHEPSTNQRASHVVDREKTFYMGVYGLSKTWSTTGSL